jgi:hypothetical protein
MITLIYLPITKGAMFIFKSRLAISVLVAILYKFTEDQPALTIRQIELISGLLAFIHCTTMKLKKLGRDNWWGNCSATVIL